MSTLHAAISNHLSLRSLRRPVQVDLVHRFEAMGSVYHVEASCYLPNNGDAPVVRVDSADGVLNGAAKWWMGATFERLIGRVEFERLETEIVSAAIEQVEANQRLAAAVEALKGDGR